MKQPASPKRSAWFWVGVTLLTSSILFWLILIWGGVAASEDIGVTILAGFILIVIPLGIGIYGIRRGRKAPVAQSVREARQSTGRKSSAWFWVGVILLSTSALLWLILISASEDIGETILAGVIFTAIPIGIGIYGIRRGRKPPAVDAQRGPEPVAQPVQETSTGSKIVLRRPVWFYVVGWLVFLLPGAFLVVVSLSFIISGELVLFFLFGAGLGLLLFGIWFVGWTTRVTLDQAVGYMTVTRGHCPLFLWFLRTKRISKEEARSVSVCSEPDKYFGSVTAYHVMVTMSSGKEVKLYDDWKYHKADYLAKRILDFAQEAEVELSPGAKFSMRVDKAFTDALGMVVGGRVEQGTITNGDDVEIRGRGRRKKAKVFEVDTLKGSGGQGERIQLLIEDLTEDDVKWGDVVEKV